MLNRRTFLKASSAAVACGLSAPALSFASTHSVTKHLTAQESDAFFFGPSGPATKLWSYNGTSPGPVIRVPQGEHVKITLENKLRDDTTIHWHGLRIPNGMDGVPYLNQAPVKPGEQFTYSFTAQDAGTFWYHPHVNSAEQVGRGLAGAFIVEEAQPPEVDQDITWVLDDWRLDREGTLAPFTLNMHDAAHGGRLGNYATINGQVHDGIQVRKNERIRLRLINMANARIFGLRFKGHTPLQIAVDGHPITPTPLTDLAVVPPGGRLDLILDMTADDGKEYEIEDGYIPQYSFTLSKLIYGEGKALRPKVLPAFTKLPSNPVPALDLKNAEVRTLAFEGGAMGSLREASYKGKTHSLRELAGMGMVWSVNGEMIPAIQPDDIDKPMLDLKLGQTYILRLVNSTAFEHPIHLHGHSFRLLSMFGKKLKDPMVMDTVLIQPGQFADVAFVADNPGDWALHCHILEHAEVGMMGFVRVR